jgi:hypothetical protein
MTRRICILGSAPSSRDLAPFDDKEVEFWTLAQRVEKRADRIFEIHCKEIIEKRNEEKKVKSLADYLNNRYPNNPPVYTIEKFENIINRVDYPLQKAIDFVKSHGGNEHYISSSISYMIALAILEQVDEILIYGVSMTHKTEYKQQRPNCEWLLGIASGLGIKITIPEQSPLLKAKKRYGVL